ncbi:MAG: hypothetical protein NZ108_09130, partial [Bacteroidia bacterium]|nr:hypothetical protein [Bacteroidia bacterium]
DELGGLDKAISDIAKKANLGDKYSVVEYPEVKKPIEAIIEKLSGKDDETMIKLPIIREHKEIIQLAKRLSAPDHRYMLLPYQFEIQ